MKLLFIFVSMLLGMGIKAELAKMTRVNVLSRETENTVVRGAHGLYEVIRRDLGYGFHLFEQPVDISQGVRANGIGVEHDVLFTPRGTCVRNREIVKAMLQINGEHGIISVDSNGLTTLEVATQNEEKFYARYAPLLKRGQRRERAYERAGINGITTLELLHTLYVLQRARKGRDIGTPDIDLLKSRWKAEMPGAIKMPRGVPVVISHPRRRYLR